MTLQLLFIFRVSRHRPFDILLSKQWRIGIWMVIYWIYLGYWMSLKIWRSEHRKYIVSQVVCLMSTIDRSRFSTVGGDLVVLKSDSIFIAHEIWIFKNFYFFVVIFMQGQTKMCPTCSVSNSISAMDKASRIIYIALSCSNNNFNSMSQFFGTLKWRVMNWTFYWGGVETGPTVTWHLSHYSIVNF